MYIGSVRFFKHLILTVIALLIIVPTVGCVCLALECHKLKVLVQEQAALIQLAAAEITAEEDGAVEPASEDEPKTNDPVLTVYAADQLPDMTAGAIPYQLKYPQLYVENDFQYVAETEKTIYLTFDDGPTGLTPQVLDILKSRGVPATFFVVHRAGGDSQALYRRIVDEGHTLAAHSASHDYKKIYSSVEAFLDDFAVLSDTLEEVTGVKPELIRFPGGSINNYNKSIQTELIAELLRRGYTYYDWDVSSGSSTNTATVSSVYSNVINGVSGKQRAIVLLHDAGTSATVTALPDIIDTLAASGYKFEALDKKVMPACFDYSN